MKFDFLKIYFIAGPQDFPDLSISEAGEKIGQIIRSGVSAYQFRDKGTVYPEASVRLNLVKKLQEVARRASVFFIINDDVDLAIEIGAQGLHLGQDDEQLAVARQRLPKDVIIGLSVRNEAELRQAQNAQADYLGIGPIYPTSSKTDAASALGIEQLRQLLPQNRRPIVAIGGIDSSNLAGLSQIGLDGLALISMLTQADSVDKVIRRINKEFTKD